MSADLRDELTTKLLAGESKLSTSTAGRLSRTGWAMLRAARLMRKAQKKGAESLDAAALVRLVTSLGQLKGIAMKMGQIMSYIDIALPEPLRQALTVLQTHAQPMAPAQLEALLRDDLPASAAEQILATLEPTPLAAASIGQVHRARLPDGTAVAVKVRYPEVDRAIEKDFAPAALGSHIAALIYPGAKIDGFIAEAKARFLEECDYRHEAAQQALFGRLYAGHPRIVVPAVFEPFCGDRVLTTELMRGRGLEAFLADDPPQGVRDALGEALFSFYIGTLFRHGVYHCDPHPGNYLFLDAPASDETAIGDESGPRIALLDYGCTRSFEPAFVAKLARLTKAVHADAPHDLRACFSELGMITPGRDYDYETARGLVRAFFGPMLEDATQAIVLDDAMDMRSAFEKKKQLMKLALPGEFLFLFRIRFGLMSVLSRLGARANWYRLEQAWVNE